MTYLRGISDRDSGFQGQMFGVSVTMHKKILMRAIRLGHIVTAVTLLNTDSNLTNTDRAEKEPGIDVDRAIGKESWWGRGEIRVAVNVELESVEGGCQSNAHLHSGYDHAPG
jgi:hypothetical protein